MSLLDKASLVQIPSGYGEDKLYSVIPDPNTLSELVINGDFATNSDWTIGGAGGSISGGQLTLALGGSAYQISGNIIANTQVEVNIQGTGTVYYRFDVNSSSPTIAATLPYTATVNTGTGNMGIQLMNLGGSVIIDSVSIKSSSDGDFDFSRSSSATRVNSEGLIEEVPWNLNNNSEDLNSYTKLNVVVTSDDIISPRGTQDADKLETTSNNSYKLLKTNSVSFVSGVDYTFSFYAKKGTTDFIQLITTNTLFGATSEWANFDLNNGVVSLDNYGGASIEDVGNGWFRCSITSTCVSSGTDGWFISVITSGTSTRAESTSNVVNVYVWGIQVVKGSSAKTYIKTTDRLDIPRLDYSGGATCPTLLLEPQRTNLQTYSEDLTNGAWITNNASVVPNQTTSPDGTTTADKVDYGSGSGFIRNGVTLGSATTFSIFVKYFDVQWVQIMTSGDVNHYANFDVQNGVLGNVGSSTEAEIEDYGNGWYRIVAKFVSGTFTGQPRLYKISSGVRPWAGGDGDAGSYYMWGGQQEVGTFQTSYIPTASSTVTRNADSGILTSASALIGQTEGTLYSEFNLTEDSAFTILEINLGNSTNDRILAYRNASYIAFIVQAGGVVEINNSTLVTFLDTNKIAITYQANNFKIYLNGSLVKAYTSGSIPSGFDTIDLQDNNLAGKKQSIKSLILFKEILSDTELTTLTTL